MIHWSWIHVIILIWAMVAIYGLYLDRQILSSRKRSDEVMVKIFSMIKDQNREILRKLGDKK